MPKASLPLLPTRPLSAYTEGVFPGKLFFNYHTVHGLYQNFPGTFFRP